MAEALASQVAALSLEESGIPTGAVFSIIATATFADFSIDRFVALTKADYDPNEFPAAKLRTPDQGTFVAFRNGNVLLFNKESEAVAHRALADLATELRCTLAVAPHTDSIPCHLPACHAISARMVTQRVPWALLHGSGSVLWRFEPPHQNVEVRINRDGSADIHRARAMQELRLVVREVQRLVQECAATEDGDEEGECIEEDAMAENEDEDVDAEEEEKNATQ